MDGSAVEILDSRDVEVAMTHTRRRSSWLRKIWVVLGLHLGRNRSEDMRNSASDERRKRKHSMAFHRFALVGITPQIGLGHRCSIP